MKEVLRIMDQEKVKILRVFQINSKKLNEAVKKHIPAKTTIKYKVNEPIKVEGEIDVTVEAGLVSSARLFLGDNVSEFGRIANILSEHYREDKTKVSRLREYKKAWKGIFGPHSLFRIGTERDGLTNKKVFDLIVNGSHLHSDLHDEHLEFQQSWTYPMLRIQLQSLILDIRTLTRMLCAEFVDPILESSTSDSRDAEKNKP